MDTDLAPIDVAEHWPFIERHLNLHRRHAETAVLGLLARLQLESEGEPIKLGRARLMDAGMTRGEAGGAWRVLADLEDRRVLARFRGAGRRADAWTFRADIGHWHRMPWRRSGPAVETAIVGCFCAARRAVAARNAGQGIALRRATAEFHISPVDHLQRPGLFLVDSRGNGEARGATASGRAWEPVDSRGNDAMPGTHTALLGELEILQLGEGEKERFARLLKVVEYHAQPNTVWSGSAPEKALVALAAQLSDHQVARIVKTFDQTTGRVSIPAGVELMRQLAAKAPPDRELALA